MNTQHLLAWIAFSILTHANTASAGSMPQDTWSFYGKKLAIPDSAQKKCIAVSSSIIFVGATNTSFETTSIQKYNADGTYVTTFTTTFSDVTGMACDSTGNLYAFDRAAAALKSFDASGNLLWSIGGTGAGQAQFSTTSSTTQHTHLAIDENDKLYVLDRGNSRVQRFDKLGNFEALWGTPGTLSGQLNNPMGVVARNGKVLILDNSASNRQRLQIFTSDGVFVNSRDWTVFSPTNAGRLDRFAFAPDGTLPLISTGLGSMLLDMSLQTIGTIALPTEFNTYPPNRFGGAFTLAGDLWTINGAEVWLLERRYSDTDNPVVRSVLPQPEVISVAQRPASTLLDIDFKVSDSDSATADVEALAFVNGSDTLADVLRIATLEEGTDSNVGPGQTTNVAKRLTWNAAADWSSEFGEVQIEILAKDQRDLLGIHWITVPASGGTPSFEASAKPIDDTELLSLWYWLIAKGDPEVVLLNGEVEAVGGALDGQTLASGITTTTQGRQFLYGRLGVRAITTDELTSIQSGNYGFSSSSTLTAVRP